MLETYLSHSIWLSGLIELYNSNQPRDYRGRWASGAAFEAAKAGTAVHTATIEKAKAEGAARAHIAGLKKVRNAEFDRLKAAHATMPMQSAHGKASQAETLKAYDKPPTERLAALKAKAAAFEAKTGKTLGIKPAMQSAHGQKVEAVANNPPLSVHTTTGNRVAMQKPKFFDGRKHEIVEADPAKLAAHIKATQPDHFVDSGGVGSTAKKGAYEGVNSHVAAGKPLDTPVIQYDHRKQAIVSDGRHRLAYLKDHGATSVPVMVNKSGAKEFKERFGSGKERDLFGNEATPVETNARRPVRSQA